MQRFYFIFIIGFFVIAVALGMQKASQIKSTPTLAPPPPQKTQVNIVVLSPKNNQSVENPFLVRGRARVFENVLSIRLMSKSGQVLTETKTNTNALDSGEFGDFEAYVGYSTQEKSGTLEVFASSAKDSSQIDLVKIPVHFQ